MSQNNNENQESNLPPQAPANSPPSSNVMSEILVRAEWHAGPLPPPDVLERYEQMHPGTLDRLLTIAEKEQQARIEHNVKAGEYKFRALEIRGRNSHSNNVFAHCGQIFAFVSVVLYFAILAMTVWVGNVMMFTALFCAGAFAGLARLIRSFQHKKENQDQH